MIDTAQAVSGGKRLWLAVYLLVWPVLTLLVFLYNDRATPTFRADFIPHVLVAAYLFGAVPAILVGALVDMLGLHTARIDPTILVGGLIAIGIAGALSYTVLFVVLFFVPSTLVCCLLVRALNRLFGR